MPELSKPGTELLPCPFCGHAPVWAPARLSGRIIPAILVCINGECFGPHTTATGDDAIAQWNKRSVPAQQQPIDHVREALEFYADPKRYNGANQRIEGEPDGWQPFEFPYLWDVTRDGGHIARDALRAVPPQNDTPNNGS